MSVLFYALIFLSSAHACKGHLNINILPKINTSFSSAVIGDVLYKKEGTLSTLAGKDIKFICNEGNGLQQITAIGKLHSLSLAKNTYATNLSGVGIRITMALQQKEGFKWKKLPFYFSEKVTSTFGADDIYMRIELIKTADEVAPGQLNYDENNALLISVNNQQSVYSVGIHLSGLMTSGTCDILTDLINVDMGVLTVDKSKGYNGDTGRTDFAVPVSCENVHGVFMTIKGNLYKGLKDTIALMDMPGSAKGVGIRLTYKDIPVVLDKPVDISDLFQQTTKNNILLSANYFVSDNEIEPGLVTAMATLRIDYL